MRIVRAAASLAIALAVAGCAAPGPTNVPEATPVVHVAEADGFSLQVGVPRSSFASTDAIPVQATLTWLGAAQKAAIWGSGMGPASYTFVEVGGRGRTLGGVMTADCVKAEYTRGVPVAIPLRKGAAYSADDPQAAFFEAWNADPVFRLPAGHWQIQVSVDGLLGPCQASAPELRLRLPPIDLEIH